MATLVMGVVRRRQTVVEAFRKKALHGATMSLKEGVRDADVVLLCSPISTIVQQIKLLRPLLKPNALVMDVASSKLLVDLAAKKYLKGVRFVGCHPMAGSAKTGVEHADGDLFQNAVCFLTHADKGASAFWKALGTKIFYLTPASHDEWVAHTSHLPHILSFALFQSGGARRLDRFGLKASNPSIHDLARLSKSDPKLWADILLSNGSEILKSLEEYQSSIARLKKALRSGRSGDLQKFILKANAVSHRLAPEAVSRRRSK
jgi:prephenate dehydrogenase